MIFSTQQSFPEERDSTAQFPEAVLFDLDGTLLNTEQPWLDAARSLLSSLGRELTDKELLGFEGTTVIQAAHRIVRQYSEDRLPEGYASLGDLGDDLQEQALRRQHGNIRWCAGAPELLAQLHSDGVPLALVTSSSRRWFENLAGQVDLSQFEFVITADDVVATKPHPTPYLLAAEMLGVDPSIRNLSNQVRRDRLLWLGRFRPSPRRVVNVRDSG